MTRLLAAILSKLLPSPLDEPLSPRHRHALVHRDEMDREPIEDHNNWSPSPQKRVAVPKNRPYLWRIERQESR